MAKASTKADEYVFDGDIQSAPDWVDRGWASYDAGPALAVPRGDPNGQPYTTVTARKGDMIVRVPKTGDSPHAFDAFKVVPASEFGGNPTLDKSEASPLPAQQTSASLEDLDKSGALKYSEMDDEQRAQFDARAQANGAPAANPQTEGKPGPAGSAERVSGEGAQTTDAKATRTTAKKK